MAGLVGCAKVALLVVDDLVVVQIELAHATFFAKSRTRLVSVQTSWTNLTIGSDASCTGIFAWRTELALGALKSNFHGIAPFSSWTIVALSTASFVYKFATTAL